MKHEKIIEREDGSKVKWITSLWLNNYENTFCYDVVAWHWPKGKRAWIEIDYYPAEIRHMSEATKKEYQRKTLLQYLTEEELAEAKLELWMLLKPSL